MGFLSFVSTNVNAAMLACNSLESTCAVSFGMAQARKMADNSTTPILVVVPAEGDCLVVRLMFSIVSISAFRHALTVVFDWFYNWREQVGPFSQVIISR